MTERATNALLTALANLNRSIDSVRQSIARQDSMMRPWNWKAGQSASESPIDPEPKRDDQGRYIVHLPGKQSPIRLTPEDYERWLEAKKKESPIRLNPEDYERWLEAKKKAKR